VEEEGGHGYRDDHQAIVLEVMHGCVHKVDWVGCGVEDVVVPRACLDAGQGGVCQPCHFVHEREIRCAIDHHAEQY
jgi:hypothetical protein